MLPTCLRLHYNRYRSLARADSGGIANAKAESLGERKAKVGGQAKRDADSSIFLCWHLERDFPNRLSRHEFLVKHYRQRFRRPAHNYLRFLGRRTHRVLCSPGETFCDGRMRSAIIARFKKIETAEQ